MFYVSRGAAWAVLGCVVIVAGTAIQSHGALIHEWNLDEGSGTTVSPQVGSFSGSFSGTITWQSAGPPSTYVLGGSTVTTTHSLSFGGTKTDYIDFGTDTALAPSYITVALWAKMGDTATPNNAELLARYSSAPGSYEIGFTSGKLEWRFFTADGGCIRVGYAGSGYTPYTNTQFDDGNWHFLVGTYDGTTGSLYVDGNLITSLSTSPNTINQPAGQPFNLGRRPYSGAEEPFPGWIGGPVLIYDTALNAAQVRALSVVPEPPALTLLAMALVGLLGFAWRKRK